MNWIKNNPFVSALAGITVLICGLLYFFASKGGTRYDEAKAEFDEAYGAVVRSESIPLYPTAANRDAKKKALDDYRESINGLRGLFDKYRQDEIENISTQAFTERLKATNEEVTEALTSAGCEIPDGFFMGFESYRNTLAQSGATGVLDYQLNGLKRALLDLAEARPSKLIKVYREKIPEETGGEPVMAPNEVARMFAFEVCFKGSEDSARKFLTALGATDPYYFIVRCIRIDNERDIPPMVSDAKFERPEPEPEKDLSPFGAGFSFGLEEEIEQPSESPDAPAEEAEVEADVTEAPKSVDSTRILAQVLGAEELLVFVRFDLTMFLPVKELPKP